MFSKTSFAFTCYVKLIVTIKNTSNSSDSWIFNTQVGRFFPTQSKCPKHNYMFCLFIRSEVTWSDLIEVVTWLKWLGWSSDLVGIHCYVWIMLYWYPYTLEYWLYSVKLFIYFIVRWPCHIMFIDIYDSENKLFDLTISKYVLLLCFVLMQHNLAVGWQSFIGLCYLS